jgi:ADP-heptose:LPS heptosyltransferase
VRVTALVRAAVRPILERLDSLDELLVYDPARYGGIGGVRRLAALLRTRRFDAAVALQSHAGIAWATLLAGVPVRIGPLSKAHSFVVYNRGRRQRRSRVAHHEADYNLQLLEPLGVRVPPDRFFPEIALAAEARVRARDWLTRNGWSEGARWVAVHPGMGGSARNWPLDRYLALAGSLRAAGHDVLVTTGPGEAAIAAHFAGHRVHAPAPDDAIDVLAALYESMAVLVAPSTGPLHVAAAAGTPVVGLYPNLRVQSPARWGPRVADAARAVVLVPAVDCTVRPDCMATIGADDVVAAVERLLRSAGHR